MRTASGLFILFRMILNLPVGNNSRAHDKTADGEVVGARQWNGTLTDIPAMGDDGNDFTKGYLSSGVMVLFKIYDTSEDEYYDAIPSEYIPWANNAYNFIDNLSADISVFGCTDIDACNYDEAATVNDGSCEYAEENYDCDGNCIVELDCNDECGGSAVVDECGVCGGDGIAEGACAVSAKHLRSHEASLAIV